MYLIVHNFIDTFYFVKLCFSEAKNLDELRSFKFSEHNFLLKEDMGNLIEAIGQIKRKYQRVDSSFDALINLDKGKQGDAIKLKKCEVVNLLFEKNKVSLNLA